MFQTRKCRWTSFARWALASSAAVMVALSSSAVRGAPRQNFIAEAPVDFEEPETALGTGCSTDADCDDGLFCNGQEVCDSGGCVSLGPPCDADICDENADQCGEGGSQSTFCAYLGDHGIQGRQDKDTFYFDATFGESLNIVVDENPLDDSTNGGEAIVSLQGFPAGAFYPLLNMNVSGSLPLSFDTTAGFSGTFRVVIRPNPRPNGPDAEPMRGSYCLSIDSSMGAASNLEAGDNVESDGAN